MCGNAVDIIFIPGRCKSSALRAYGFEGVCPHYHHGHCHIEKCGTPRSVQRAREVTRDRARQIRRNNRSARPRVASAVPVQKRKTSKPGLRRDRIVLTNGSLGKNDLRES